MFCSRCTGYRPILDAFRVFSEVPAGAYTEEAIAAHSQKAGDKDDVVGLPQPIGYPANGGTIKMDPSKAVGAPYHCLWLDTFTLRTKEHTIRRARPCRRQRLRALSAA